MTRIDGPGQPTQASADVHGWYDAVLVSLEIRGGRMNRWQQRLLPREPAARTAVTPPDWRDFAAVNARLGAALLTRTAAQVHAGSRRFYGLTHREEGRRTVQRALTDRWLR